jgi:hypothetical protein
LGKEGVGSQPAGPSENVAFWPGVTPYDVLIPAATLIVGFLSGRALSRRSRSAALAVELYNILAPTFKGNYMSNLLNQEDEIRARSAFLGPGVRKLTEDLLSRWHEGATLEREPEVGLENRKLAERRRAELRSEADQIVRRLLKKLGRIGRQ